MARPRKFEEADVGVATRQRPIETGYYSSSVDDPADAVIAGISVPIVRT